MTRAALACLLLTAACVHRAPSEVPRTIVFVAKRVRTLDPNRPLATALVVRDGRVLLVGDEAEALQAAGPGAAVERWPDSTIVPGLVDAHGHVASLGRARAVLNLGAARSEAEAVALAQGTAPQAMQGGWRIGRGWDQNDWAVKAFPTRASLDAAFPEVPVFLTRVDGHAVWVNGEALKRAGVTRHTKDPEGGRFQRDAAGELTGVAIDNAIDVISKAIPPPSEVELEARVKVALETCARLGLTGVHDAGLDLRTFRLLQRWDLLGALPVRLYAMADGQGDDAEAFREQGLHKGRRLELRAVKLVADGALGSRGAALQAPYSDEPSHAGLLLLSPQELERRATAFHAAGFQVAVHAIGDRATGLVIDVLGRLEAKSPGSRHRVEHAQVLTEADVGRLAKAGLIASMQPTHATSDMPWAEARLGAARARFAYAWKSVAAAGAPLAFGSDFPVEDPNPLWGLYAARTRLDHQGQPSGGWHPDEAVSGEAALRAFTVGSAFAGFAEQRRGMLRPGFDADFVVLPVDPVDDAPEVLLTARVQVTVVDGIDVYRAP